MDHRPSLRYASLDLSPNPDSGFFGNREEPEEESGSAESENDSEKEDGSDASNAQQRFYQTQINQQKFNSRKI